MVEPGLQWHPALYAGSARYYAIGRVGYPPALAKAVAEQLGLDGSGRLLDVGCGPGSLTLLLAPWFEQATGVDADRDMLAEASRLDAFEADLRRLLHDANPRGIFSEQMREIAIDVWRPSRG